MCTIFEAQFNDKLRYGPLSSELLPPTAIGFVFTIRLPATPDNVDDGTVICIRVVDEPYGTILSSFGGPAAMGWHSAALISHWAAMASSSAYRATDSGVAPSSTDSTCRGSSLSASVSPSWRIIALLLELLRHTTNEPMVRVSDATKAMGI